MPYKDRAKRNAALRAWRERQRGRPARKPIAAAVRFMAHVSPEPNSGCWLWTAAISTNGYGLLSTTRSRQVRAHRFAYESMHGPIPDGLYICHRCDTPSCVNPDHLFLGTPRDNLNDAKSKGRYASQSTIRRQATHCARGHGFTPENTLWRKDAPGRRGCRACKRIRGRNARS